jgi:hypothetical protein
VYICVERRLPNDTLIIALYNKWLAEKTPKKFSINIEQGANAGASTGQSEFDARAEQKAKRLSAPPGSLTAVSKRTSSTEVVAEGEQPKKGGSGISRSTTTTSTSGTSSPSNGSAILVTPAPAPVGPVGRPMSGVMSSPVDGTHSPDVS